jgi:hypothetical protein
MKVCLVVRLFIFLLVALFVFVFICSKHHVSFNPTKETTCCFVRSFETSCLWCCDRSIIRSFGTTLLFCTIQSTKQRSNKRLFARSFVCSKHVVSFDPTNKTACCFAWFFQQYNMSNFSISQNETKAPNTYINGLYQ